MNEKQIDDFITVCESMEIATEGTFLKFITHPFKVSKAFNEIILSIIPNYHKLYSLLLDADSAQLYEVEIEILEYILKKLESLNIEDAVKDRKTAKFDAAYIKDFTSNIRQSINDLKNQQFNTKLELDKQDAINAKFASDAKSLMV